MWQNEQRSSDQYTVAQVRAQGCSPYPEEIRTNRVEETESDSHHTVLCRYYYCLVLHTRKII